MGKKSRNLPDGLTRDIVRKIEHYKKMEKKKEAKRLKRLEKEEDKAFEKLRKQKKNTKITYFSPPYTVTILFLLFLSIIYLIVSSFQNKITKLNNILFFLITIGFILTSTIQKKQVRKTVSFITCILLILWIILHI